jgi:hypothetical protein
MHTYNPSIQKLRQKELEFQASLDYIVRPCKKKKTILAGHGRHL